MGYYSEAMIARGSFPESQLDPPEPDWTCDWCDEECPEDDGIADANGCGWYHPACLAEKEDR